MAFSKGTYTSLAFDYSKSACNKRFINQTLHRRCCDGFKNRIFSQMNERTDTRFESRSTAELMKVDVLTKIIITIQGDP